MASKIILKPQQIAATSYPTTPLSSQPPTPVPQLAPHRVVLEAPRLAPSASPPPSLPHRYEQEIAQMLFVAGEVREPLQETTHQVEDIVKSQVIELAIRAKNIANRRGSRAVAPEDLLFLFRDDRPKVNRLKTFLSWMDVRKNTRNTTENLGHGPVGLVGGSLGIDVLEGLEEGAPDQITTTLPKTIVKLPWELTSIYSDFLDERQASSSSFQPSSIGGFDLGLDDFSSTATTEYEDHLHQLYKDNLQRLKTADEVTKNMTKETYAYYSECRQASFTFKKGKRFRDFINFSLYLEAKPSDDIIDILGFLAFEVVHNLGVQALQVKRELEGAPPPAPPPPPQSAPAVVEAPPPSATSSKATTTKSIGAPPPPAPSSPPVKDAATGGLFAREPNFIKSPSSSLSPLSPLPSSLPPSPAAADAPPPSAPAPPAPIPSPTEPTSTKRPLPDASTKLNTKNSKRPRAREGEGWWADEEDQIVCGLFASPPREANRTPLKAGHVMEAYARVQRREARRKTMGLELGGEGRRREGGLV